MPKPTVANEERVQAKVKTKPSGRMKLLQQIVEMGKSKIREMNVFIATATIVS